MAAPPAGACEEDLPEGCEEERCQRPRCCWEIDAVQRIHERLRRTAGRSHQPQPEHADPACPYYERRLYRHLQRMPARYLADVDLDAKAEDVRLHWRILDECADTSKRPVLHARYLKSIMVPAGYSGGDYELDMPCPRLMESLISLERRKAVDDNDSTSSRVVHLHEIIFCTLDKHGLLSRLSALIDEVRLHVRECHLYCTADGFCLALFVVDGWETEEADGLIAKIMETLTLKNI